MWEAYFTFHISIAHAGVEGSPELCRGAVVERAVGAGGADVKLGLYPQFRGQPPVVVKLRNGGQGWCAGKGECVFLPCDLTAEYVRINADYWT